MVRVINEEYYGDGLRYKQIVGLSTDTKPTGGILTGSEFFEIDTGDRYYYDEDGDAGSEWVKPGATK